MERAKHVYELHHLTTNELLTLEDANRSEAAAIQGQLRRRKWVMKRYMYFQTSKGKRELRGRDNPVDLPEHWLELRGL